MAKLSKGITLATNEYISAAKLHALIDTAIAASDAYPGTPALYDIVMSDLLTVRAVHTASSPSTPSTNDLAVGSDGMLDRYNGSAWVDLSTDVQYFVNGSSYTLVTGTPVVADAADGTKITLWTGSGVCPRPFGVSVTVCGSGATASIQTRGLAPVKINNPTLVAVDTHLRIAAQGATMLSSTSATDTSVLGVLVLADVANPTSGNGIARLFR